METEEQTLEREQNERDVLEALGEYKCDSGMSVENVLAVVKTKTLTETYYWTEKLKRERYGEDKYWVLLAVVKE